MKVIIRKLKTPDGEIINQTCPVLKVISRRKSSNGDVLTLKLANGETRTYLEKFVIYDKKDP